MWVWFGAECKLLHHIVGSQIVAATSINNHMTGTLLNDTFGLEQRMSLILLRLLHLCTKHTLHNETRSVQRHLRQYALLVFPRYLHGQQQTKQVYLHQNH
jgi:hypothetical protein